MFFKNQVGKIKLLVVCSLILIISMPVLLLRQYEVISAVAPAGKVIEVSGNVSELKYTRSDQTRTLKLNDNLNWNDVVKTGATSTARLRLTDVGAKKLVGMFLYENSTLHVNKAVVKAAGKKDYSVKLVKGFLRGIAKGLKGDQINISVPGGTVGVRGSRFSVGVGSDGSFSVFGVGDIFFKGVQGQILKITNNVTHLFNKSGEALGKFPGAFNPAGHREPTTNPASNVTPQDDEAATEDPVKSTKAGDIAQKKATGKALGNLTIKQLVDLAIKATIFTVTTAGGCQTP